MPHPQVGQKGLELPGAEHVPSPRQFDPEQVVAISSMIKYITEVRNLQPDITTERDVHDLNPEKIESGLYVPEGVPDSKQKHARGGVIFSPEEYADLTISPARVAGKVINKVWKDHPLAEDKSVIEAIARAEAKRALENHLGRFHNLADALRSQEEFFDLITKELGGARGTGYFAHYKAIDLKMKLADAETAIFATLDVAAITKEWGRGRYARAKHALSYQLFGDHEERYGYWKAYAKMAKTYAYRRRKIIENTEKPIESELRKYEAVTERE